MLNVNNNNVADNMPEKELKSMKTTRLYFMDEIQKVQFMPYELSEKAFEIYSNSDFVFYIDHDGCYLWTENSKSTYYEQIGTLKDVEKFLLAFERI